MMKKFSKEKVELIRKYAFLDKIQELNLPEGKKIYLRYGHHYQTPPFVEIIIPTYKRPQMLLETLQSIFSSKDFDDYQIIIMDNEGIAECSGITKTEQMIRELDDSRIVYYREEENTPYNWNHLIKVARATWLCMIHDDDLIDPYHMNIMYNVIKKREHIEFLGCRRETFSNENRAINTVGKREEVEVVYYAPSKYLWGLQTSLLGAFFKRENAIEIGGFDTTILSGIGDYIFVAKQAYYFNTYCCDLPLYKYRLSMGQITANEEGEFNCRISDYYLMRDIAKRTHPVMWRLYDKMIDRNWLHKVQAVCNDRTYGEREISVDEICVACNVNINDIRRKDVFSFLYTIIHSHELHFPQENVKL